MTTTACLSETHSGQLQCSDVQVHAALGCAHNPLPAVVLARRRVRLAGLPCRWAASRQQTLHQLASEMQLMSSYVRCVYFACLFCRLFHFAGSIREGEPGYR